MSLPLTHPGHRTSYLLADPLQPDAEAIRETITTRPYITDGLKGRLLSEFGTPAEVTNFVDNLRLPPDEQRNALDEYTFCYLFGGREVACRLTPNGVEILKVASGSEMGVWLDSLSDFARQRISHISRPESWATILERTESFAAS